VVLGETRTYGFERITHAIRLVLGGARFIATNPDPAGPSAAGPIPATGSIAALISRATDVDPHFVGKPNPLMMRSALNSLGAHSESTTMIGDRMDTDIVAGLEAGLETILVLSGGDDPHRGGALPVSSVADRGLSGRPYRRSRAVSRSISAARRQAAHRDAVSQDRSSARGRLGGGGGRPTSVCMKAVVTATLNGNGERDLADEVLARIEERENEVRATLERLIKQRAAISGAERDAAWDALRAEAMTARGELRRLRLLASMADALLRPVSLRQRSRPTRGAKRR
jgi:phosphoglycolate phosphatase-like HAD superfamily hydrolase